MGFDILTSVAQPATIVKALAIGGLGAGIVSKFLMSSPPADATAAPKKIFGRAGPAMVRLTLKSSEDINHNTKLLRFELPAENAISGLPLTSALLTASWPKGQTLPVLRPYTPVTPSDTPGILDLMVKKYPNGKQSTHLHSLQSGDSLLFAVTIPGYAYTPNKHSHVTLIAGGMGITPMYQLIQGILRNPEDKTKITLVYGVNTDEDALLQKEFSAYEKQFPGQFKVEYTVGEPKEGSPFRKGFVTGDLLEKVTVGPGEESGKVFVCGPPAMEAALMGGRGTPGVLEKLGYKKEQIYKF